jgi:hypothetical protein
MFGLDTKDIGAGTAANMALAADRSTSCKTTGITIRMSRTTVSIMGSIWNGAMTAATIGMNIAKTMVTGTMITATNTTTIATSQGQLLNPRY